MNTLRKLSPRKKNLLRNEEDSDKGRSPSLRSKRGLFLKRDQSDSKVQQKGRMSFLLKKLSTKSASSLSDGESSSNSTAVPEVEQSSITSSITSEERDNGSLSSMANDSQQEEQATDDDSAASELRDDDSKASKLRDDDAFLTEVVKILDFSEYEDNKQQEQEPFIKKDLSEKSDALESSENIIEDQQEPYNSEEGIAKETSSDAVVEQQYVEVEAVVEKDLSSSEEPKMEASEDIARKNFSKDSVNEKNLDKGGEHQKLSINVRNESSQELLKVISSEDVTDQQDQEPSEFLEQTEAKCSQEFMKNTSKESSDTDNVAVENDLSSSEEQNENDEYFQDNLKEQMPTATTEEEHKEENAKQYDISVAAEKDLSKELLIEKNSEQQQEPTTIAKKYVLGKPQTKTKNTLGKVMKAVIIIFIVSGVSLLIATAAGNQPEKKFDMFSYASDKLSCSIIDQENNEFTITNNQITIEQEVNNKQKQNFVRKLLSKLKK